MMTMTSTLLSVSKLLELSKDSLSSLTWANRGLEMNLLRRKKAKLNACEGGIVMSDSDPVVGDTPG